MNILDDVITYVRRIVKTPSNAALSNNLIIDYINRFWLMDMDARMQLFDLKTKYQFQTSPGIHQYNMPLYNTNGYTLPGGEPIIEPGNQYISYYPVYQGFMSPAFINGIQVPFYNERGSFFNIWPNYGQSNNEAGFGNGGASYTLQMPFFPALVGHVDITGIIAAANYDDEQTFTDPIVSSTLNLGVAKTSTYPAVYITTQDENNNTIVVTDSGQFLLGTGVTGNTQLGLLTGAISPGWGPATNVVNYFDGTINVTFNTNIPNQVPIQVMCYYIQQGIPRAILFSNNVITIMPPPDVSYLVEMDAYLSPAAFLSTSQSIPFAYMSEYIARGAARKILSDTGDIEQFAFYETLFREQEMLVWKRSQRQFTTTRIPTIFSEFSSQSPSNNFSGGGN